MRFVESKAAVEDVVRTARGMLEQQAYSFSVKKKNQSIFRDVARFCNERFDGDYSSEAGESYVQALQQRDPPFSQAHFSTHIIAVERLNHALENDVSWRPALRPTMEYARSCFGPVLLEYNEFLKNSGKSKVDVRGRMHVVARFLAHADAQGVRELQALAPQHIYAAFMAAADKGGFRRAVTAFLLYAHRHGLTRENLSLVMPSVSRHQSVPTVYSPEEVERILAAAAASPQTGRRNYAIALLAARLGLRAGDIAALRFAHLNGNAGKIELIQSKTKVPLSLPLLPEIRAAIRDYVDHERPGSGCPEIFLRVVQPVGTPLHPHSIYTIVARAVAAAGIDAKDRRCGAHALRSSLATALVNEGNTYDAVRKALGQTSPNAIKSYVRTDVERLRGCALPVEEPGGGFAKRLGWGCGA